jgi:mannose-6-phosphate isomerase
MTSIPSVHPRPYRMQNPIQPYAWGTRDGEAFIPRLLGIAPQPGAPYAELWMGAHPKAPSAVIVEGEPVALDRWIAAHPQEVLGRAVAARFANRLPFLFKVLSAGEVLSIQAHPNKAQAEVLHARDPENYPDDNHKPELAVALDSLTALMGVKPYAGIVEALERYPELAGFIGEAVCGELRRGEGVAEAEQRLLARKAFATLVTRSISAERELAQAIDALAARLSRTPGDLREEERLFLDLRAKYPGADVGLPAILLLNLVHLTEGQGMFIAAGVPHAYVRGNIIECMANSDNVVRVGLTPKFKDARALVEILSQEPQPIAILSGGDAAEIVYRTPAPEFQVSRRRMRPGEERVEASGGRLVILLITRGEVRLRWGAESEAFRQGESILIPALLDEFTVRAESPVELFRAEVPR